MIKGFVVLELPDGSFLNIGNVMGTDGTNVKIKVAPIQIG